MAGPSCRAGLENLSSALSAERSPARQRPGRPQLSAIDRRADLALAQSMAELVELISDLRALKGLHRPELVEQAWIVDGSVIPARQRYRPSSAKASAGGACPFYGDRAERLARWHVKLPNLSNISTQLR
jgi:hypothetical protein